MNNYYPVNLYRIMSTGSGRCSPGLLLCPSCATTRYQKADEEAFVLRFGAASPRLRGL